MTNSPWTWSPHGRSGRFGGLKLLLRNGFVESRGTSSGEFGAATLRAVFHNSVVRAGAEGVMAEDAPFLAQGVDATKTLDDAAIRKVRRPVE